ncbi:hypothetical protein [Limnoglobus roseus]|uniref:Uncharacterized protein n=1 Tax=Limnoglobus roseus TaxID=2598579 RepID=A0A5C1AGL5_9BACT|nr:hypothetical protein [Limnoglobus roseus]QEL18351.1 hypothetical protein PX52LOC_05372 [Limnoglobus roseus]
MARYLALKLADISEGEAAGQVINLDFISHFKVTNTTGRNGESVLEMTMVDGFIHTLEGPVVDNLMLYLLPDFVHLKKQ